MDKQWRSAVVGPGVIGSLHCRMLSNMPNNSLVAVCDAAPETAKKKLAELSLANTPVYGDLREMLEKEQIDVVHICTPSGDHFSPAMFAMEAGKHVICEKPMEIELGRIDQMVAASKKHGVGLAGIFQNRWNPANQAIKLAADEKRFGTLAFAGCYTQWFRSNQYYRDGGWRGTWKWDGGGAIMNQSVHAVDLLQWIAGPVKSVSAYSSSRVHPEIEVEDTMACSLQFHSGAFGVIVGTTGMYPGVPVRFEIGGENGTAVSENGLKVFKFRESRDGDAQTLEKLAPALATSGGATSNTDLASELHYKNIVAILEAWERGEEAPTSGTEARKAVAIILAMYESARQGGVPVAVA